MKCPGGEKWSWWYKIAIIFRTRSLFIDFSRLNTPWAARILQSNWMAKFPIFQALMTIIPLWFWLFTKRIHNRFGQMTACHSLMKWNGSILFYGESDLECIMADCHVFWRNHRWTFWLGDDRKTATNIITRFFNSELLIRESFLACGSRTSHLSFGLI